MGEGDNKLASTYFLMQGIGTLISWNAILNGLDYFTKQFEGINVAFNFPIAVFVAQAVANLAIMKLSKKLSFTKRIIGPLVILSIILFSIPIVTSKVAQTTEGFWTLMGILFLLGFAGTVYQSSVSGLVSFFPGKYTSLFLSGTGFAGLVMNALRTIAILVFESGETVTTDTMTHEIIFYFAFASLILICCMIAHMVFIKTDYYLSHAKLINAGKEDKEISLTYNDYEGVSDGRASVQEETSGIATMIQVFKDAKVFILCLLINYIQTFVFYPGIMLKKPTELEFSWKIVTMTTVFNIFDIVGKHVAQNRNSYNQNTVVVATASRMAFFFTFIIQVVADIPFLNTLFFAYLNIAVFAFSNGFITTASFIMGPEKVEGKKKEVAGFLSMIGLTTGIMLGTFCALPFQGLQPYA